LGTETDQYAGTNAGRLASQLTLQADDASAENGRAQPKPEGLRVRIEGIESGRHVGLGTSPEDLFVHPSEERAIQLNELLTGHMRQDRPPLTLVHQIPHGRDRRLAPPLVGGLGVVRNEVKFSTSVSDTALLDFMAAHGRLAEKWNAEAGTVPR
jgi:hypothetical protein